MSSLLENNNNNIPLPSNINNTNTDLISRGAVEAISGDTVKSILIPDDFEMAVPNFVLDFRKADELKKHQVGILTTIIDEDGDTAIYVLLKGGMNKIGMGVGYKLNKILPAGIQSVFGDKCDLYQDVEVGKPLKLLKTHDLTKMILDI